MSFFRQDGGVSPDWELFIKNFPDTGAFKISAKDEKAYIDLNAAAILGVGTDAGSTDIFSVIDALTENPVSGAKNVFSLPSGGGTKLIELKLNADGEYVTGFVRDVTERAFKAGESKEADTFAFFPRNKFIKKVQDALAQASGSAAQCCMAALHVNGMERADSELNYCKTDLCVDAVVRSLEKFENEDVYIGTKSYKEYYIFFRQLAKSEIYELFRKMSDGLSKCRITDGDGNEMQTRDGLFSATIGYCWYPTQAGSPDMMFDYADFALYRAMASGSMIKEFDFAEFSSGVMNYSASKELDELIGRNNFDYHFQPIVNASDGSVFAYEALMRPQGSSPLEVLKLARDNGRLYDIEILTFENVLAKVSKTRDRFKGKKIFINSIPECMLKSSDFNRLCERYPDIIPDVVIEFTEQSDFINDYVMGLKDIYCSKGCQIAIDDYGSGYSNSAAMVKIAPDYLKIDRSLISKINKDTRKQHFLSGIIDFARLNNIKVLAEGVETFEELNVTIRRGVDLIQGFYTGRPNPEMAEKISDEIVGEIEAINRTKPEIKTAKTYEINEKSYVPLDINKLSDDKYTDIVINCEFVYLKGNGKDMANLNIKVSDGTDTTVVLEDAFINGGVRQCVTLGDRAAVKLDCRGNNLLSYDGIGVPDNATLTLAVSGSLKIDSYRNNGCCIGSSYSEPFGRIIIDGEGSLELIANGDHSVVIGGGVTDSDGGIDIRGGDIRLTGTGEETLGIGSYDGNCDITLGACRIESCVSGDRSVSIGSLNGASVITLKNSDLRLDNSGVCTVGIGTLAPFVRKKNIPKISVISSRLELVFKGQLGAGIGARTTECDIEMTGTEAGIYFEGDKLAGIGCAGCAGSLSIDNCSINISSLSGRDSVEIGFPGVPSKITHSRINNIAVNTDNFTGM